MPRRGIIWAFVAVTFVPGATVLWLGGSAVLLFLAARMLREVFRPHALAVVDRRAHPERERWVQFQRRSPG